MTLAAATLEAALGALVPTSSEGTAIARLVDAWEAYIGEATVGGVPLESGAIGTGLAAMAAAMAGLSTPNAAVAKIAAGANAFWTTQAALPTTMWLTAPVVLVPPIALPTTLGALQFNLEGVFAAGPRPLGDALHQVAAVWHASSLGAIVAGSVPPAPPAAMVVT